MDTTNVLGIKRGIVTCLLFCCVLAIALGAITNYAALDMSLVRNVIVSTQNTPQAIKAPLKMEAVINQILKILTDGSQLADNDGIAPILNLAVRTVGIAHVPGQLIRFLMVPLGFHAPPII